MNINDVAKALKKNGYEVSVFENKEMATGIFNNKYLIMKLLDLEILKQWFKWS